MMRLKLELPEISEEKYILVSENWRQQNDGEIKKQWHSDIMFSVYMIQPSTV